jgi:glycosyltransferase involved in cell wall biosynthesis
MSRSTNNPLVSVIVRTKDRSELLKRALQSIAAQTYRPIEVVLVNDGGCQLDVNELKGILKDITLNYIRLEDSTGRAHAGNVGIENAKGEYIGFLDDDDEYYPEHIETLAFFPERDAYQIAYSVVEMVEKTPDGDRLTSEVNNRVLFAKDFSYEDLLVWNYIPLISLLFASGLLKDLLFDESFELFEDWDLLIRAADKTRFYFIKKKTSTYNQWSDMQIAFKSSSEKVKEAAIRIYSKHLNRFTPELIYRCVADNPEKQEMEKLRETIRTKDETIKSNVQKMGYLETRILEMETALSTIVGTRGWRYLEKYRRLRDKSKRWFPFSR